MFSVFVIVAVLIALLLVLLFEPRLVRAVALFVRNWSFPVFMETLAIIDRGAENVLFWAFVAVVVIPYTAFTGYTQEAMKVFLYAIMTKIAMFIAIKKLGGRI